MNVSMPIAAVLLDLEFPAPMIKAIPLLARTARPARPSGRGAAEPGRLPDGRPGGGGSRLREERCRQCLSPRSRRAPRTSSSGSTIAAYRRQIAYLFAHSPFYREKLAQGRIPDARRRSAGSTGSPTCPSPRKDEIRASCTRGESDRHASRGPTRPDRPHLLDQRHHRHAELHSADRGRISTTG